MRRTSAVLVALTLLGCQRESAPVRGARAEAHSTARSAQSDSVLTSYLEWHRDWMQLTNRHKAELDAQSERMAARYSFADSDKITGDPELLALLERQRGEMRPLMTRAPRGLTAEALEATLLGLGRVVAGPRAMTYVPGRDEAALAAARAKYGDTFVSWVLAHESTIVATLAPDR